MSLQNGIEHKALGNDVENKAVTPGEGKSACDAYTARGCDRHACLAAQHCQADPSPAGALDFSWDRDA